MAHVELRNLIKRFGKLQVVTDLSLGVEKGSFTALLGPSGCGKSTLLRMIAGLEEVNEGQVFIDGVDVTDMAPAKRRIAMVFQSYALYPHMTVRENIGFSLLLARVPNAERERRVQEVARILQLGELLDRRPAQLSGGQRQRVAIGRSLVREPEVFLFDEPLSNLDAMLRVQMRLEIANLHKQLGTTMIYVTHDQVEAMTLADKIVVLDKGQISQVGSPLELYNRPANKFVASFIGSPAMNFVRAHVTSGEADRAEVAIQGGRTVTLQARGGNPGAAPELGIRPEHIKLVAAGDPSAPLAGAIQIVERLGNSTILYVDTPAGQMVVEEDGTLEAQIGENVGLGFSPSHVHLFGSDGKAI